MIYIESHQTDPYFNLALEEYVFERMDRSKRYFMLWQNENTIVVGRYQNTAEEINPAYVNEHGIRVVRRLSGGGAVYHDSGNLNFTFIVDQNKTQDFHFQTFAIPVVKALEKIGVHAEFNGRNDITIDGKKFSGNAQYIRHGRLLHHGCIMLDSQLADVSNALQVRAAKFESKSTKSVRSRITTINAHAPEPVSMEQFKRLLRESVAQTEELEPLALNRIQTAEVCRFRDEKYAAWEWNYGHSPAYNMRVEKKFDAGLVSLWVEAEAGVIRSIRFFGDFFGSGDISVLEQAMVSLPLDGRLEEALEELHPGFFLHGITAKNLADMLLG